MGLRDAKPSFSLSARRDAAQQTMEEDFQKIFCSAWEILAMESNVLSLNLPIHVFGGPFGRFDAIFEMLGVVPGPDACSVLFLGNCVGKYGNSLEVLAFMLRLKVDYPSDVWWVRGENETPGGLWESGLREELVRRRWSLTWMERLCDLFNQLPLAAEIGGQVFCVSGGVTASLSVDSLLKIDRTLGLPEEFPLDMLFWGDPHDPASAELRQFSPKDAQEFLRANGFTYLARGRQAVAGEGYELPFGVDGGVISIWSSPGFIKQSHAGAVMVVPADGKIVFKTVRV